MWIAGLDLSMNCSGLVKWDTDDIENTFTFKSFTNTLKWESEHIISYHDEDWKNQYEKTEWFLKHILDFVKGCEVVALEDHSYDSTGLVFDIGAFIGVVKQELFRLGYKMIAIPPKTHKKYTTLNGNADKCITTDRIVANFPWIKNDRELMALKEYKSPQADIMDAFSIAYTLNAKLDAMDGKIDIKKLKVDNKKRWEVLTATSDSNKEQFWERPFDCRR